ncbi:MAG TPA: hypothetical protein VIZ64_07090 [Dokdonella sp.]
MQASPRARMPRTSRVGTLLLSTCLAALAATGMPADAAGLADLGDEFNDAGSLASWSRFHEVYGWPDKARQLDVDTTTPGALYLEPYDSAWVRDLHAPYLYKTVAGDFDVRARVRVRGKQTPAPTDTWALGGLLARFPGMQTARTWEPRRENWMFITTGIGERPGEVMTETKSTVNSDSSLKLRPFASGWVELRLVRVGSAFIALARAEGDSAWRVRDRFHRMLAPPQLQVGLVAYTTSKANTQPGPEIADVINRQVPTHLPTDMILEVDWIRFAEPKVSYPKDWYTGVSANHLTDSSTSDAELLRLLGS